MQLLGVRIDNVSLVEALDKVRELLSDGRQHYIVTPNPEFIVRAQKDEEFRKILNEADLAIPDGVGIVWASKLLGESLRERVSGTDLIEEFKVASRNFKIFLLGGRSGVAEKIAAQWPEVVGYSEEPESAVDEINRCQPDILLVSLGAPKQEKWIYENLREVPSVKIAIGVGGAFDFLAGKIKRAPVFLQKIGLEWLWRLMQEPKRLPRVFNAAVVFPCLVLKAKIKGLN